MDSDTNTFTETVHAALRKWNSKRVYESPLRGLQIVQQRIRTGDSEVKATERTLDKGVQELTNDAPEQASLLRARFEMGKKMSEVILELPWSSAHLYKIQNLGIKALAKILAEQEESFKRNRQGLLNRDLVPLSTSPLVGVEGKIAQLTPHFQSPTPPWLIALVGMGGIGKTSLADALARQLVVEGFFERVLWVSAKQETMSVAGQVTRLAAAPVLTSDHLLDFLARRLKGQSVQTWHIPEYDQIEVIQSELQKQPHLLVLDNLETVHAMTELLPFLRHFASPTKILLTSRVKLPHEGDVFTYPVPPLTFVETHQLLIQEARLRQVQALVDCNTPTAKKIYEVVGGNPLAIRLVVGQVHIYGINVVLENLRQAGGTSDELYRYLYEWTWQDLSMPCRHLLLALVVIPERGCDLPQLQQMTTLSPVQCALALEQLITQNLIDVHPDLLQPRYTIHNLTRTFLQEVVLKWD